MWKKKKFWVKPRCATFSSFLQEKFWPIQRFCQQASFLLTYLLMTFLHSPIKGCKSSMPTCPSLGTQNLVWSRTTFLKKNQSFLNIKRVDTNERRSGHAGTFADTFLSQTSSADMHFLFQWWILHTNAKRQEPVHSRKGAFYGMDRVFEHLWWRELCWLRCINSCLPSRRRKFIQHGLSKLGLQSLLWSLERT